MISLERLRRAHAVAAKVVVLFGDIYLPLFERLNNDLIAAELKVDLRALAITVNSQDHSTRL